MIDFDTNPRPLGWCNSISFYDWHVTGLVARNSKVIFINARGLMQALTTGGFEMLLLAEGLWLASLDLFWLLSTNKFANLNDRYKFLMHWFNFHLMNWFNKPHNRIWCWKIPLYKTLSPQYYSAEMNLSFLLPPPYIYSVWDYNKTDRKIYREVQKLLTGQGCS